MIYCIIEGLEFILLQTFFHSLKHHFIHLPQTGPLSFSSTKKEPEGSLNLFKNNYYSTTTFASM